jgi:hypothetical protein
MKAEKFANSPRESMVDVKPKISFQTITTPEVLQHGQPYIKYLFETNDYLITAEKLLYTAGSSRTNAIATPSMPDLLENLHKTFSDLSSQINTDYLTLVLQCHNMMCHITEESQELKSLYEHSPRTRNGLGYLNTD